MLLSVVSVLSDSAMQGELTEYFSSGLFKLVLITVSPEIGIGERRSFTDGGQVGLER